MVAEVDSKVMCEKGPSCAEGCAGIVCVVMVTGVTACGTVGA